MRKSEWKSVQFEILSQPNSRSTAKAELGNCLEPGIHYLARVSRMEVSEAMAWKQLLFDRFINFMSH